MALTNTQKYSIIIIIIIIVILLIVYFTITENFASLGTINQIQATYAPDSYMYNFNMSTRGTNRGMDSFGEIINEKPLSEYDNAYCFGADFYDNGKCGEVFIENDFGKDIDKKFINYQDQYTGTYVGFPIPNVMRPLNLYDGNIS